MKKVFQRRVRLNGIERLEDRRLLAGNVTATYFGGNLVIRGDAANNSVIVSQPTASSVLVTGVGTTINGKASVLLNGVLRGIDADMGAGNDQFGVSNNAADLNALATELSTGTPGALSGLASARTVVQNSIIVRGGNGNDAVGIIASAGGDIVVDLGQGDDAVGIENSTVNGSVVLDGGLGVDVLQIRASRVKNQVTVNGGAGSDAVRVLNSSMNGATLNGNSDNDTVDVTGSIVNNLLYIGTQEGNDTAFVGNSKVGSLTIDGGANDDALAIDNTSITYDVVLIGGLGNDGIEITSLGGGVGSALVAQAPTVIGGVLVIDGGLGNDEIDIGIGDPTEGAVTVRKDATIIGSDGVDAFFTHLAKFGRGVVVDMGAGNDSVIVTKTSVALTLLAFLGAGDDALTVTDSIMAGAELYGGAGRDGYSLFGNTINRLVRREFEYVLP